MIERMSRRTLDRVHARNWEAVVEHVGTLASGGACLTIVLSRIDSIARYRTLSLCQRLVWNEVTLPLVR